jgi:hypothetical protein
VSHEVFDELLVVFEDDQFELLQDVFQFDYLLFGFDLHDVEGSDVSDLRVEFVLDDFDEDVDDAAVVDLLQVAVVQTLLLRFQFYLPQQEIVLYVLLQHLLREVGLEFVPDDLRDAFEDLDEFRYDDGPAAHGEAYLLLDGGDVAAVEQELIDVRDLAFGGLPEGQVELSFVDS